MESEDVVWHTSQGPHAYTAPTLTTTHQSTGFENTSSDEGARALPRGMATAHSTRQGFDIFMEFFGGCYVVGKIPSPPRRWPAEHAHW